MSMPEPVYPNDETRFPPQPEPLSPREVGRLRPNLVRADRELPPPSRLSSTAETIGSAVGSAVGTVRHLPGRLQEMKERLIVIRGRKQEDAISKAREVGEDLKQSAQENLYRARTRADHLAREYPLHTFAVMAGVGMLIGIVLRIWRDHAE